MSDFIVLPLDKNQHVVDLGFGIEEEDKLILHKYEAFYLAKEGLLKIRIPKSIEKEHGYRVFKQLRDKGYVIRFSLGHSLMRVYRKGFRKYEDRTLYLLRVVSSNSIKVDQIKEDLMLANKMRKELIYALVGETITYINISKRHFA